MKRKITCLLLSCILASGVLQGCGSSEKLNTDKATETVETVETAEDKQIEKTDDAQAEATVAEKSEEEYTDLVSNVSYIEDGESYHMLDLYGTQTVKKAAPTVIEVHGGGFIGGKKENNMNHSIFFVQQGFEVVTPEYRKIPRDGGFVEAIQDLFKTYNWVEDNAQKYQFDLNNIFLSGDSAGGYYVLLTCAIFHSEELQEYFGVEVPDFDFSAYLTTCPGADIMELQRDFSSGSGPNAYVPQKIGKDLLFNEDLMSHLDLMSNIDATAFTGVYMLTTPNDTVTGKSVQTFDTYLTGKNVEHTTISYESKENDLKHTFNITNGDYSESKVANQDMVDYMKSLLK